MSASSSRSLIADMSGFARLSLQLVPAASRFRRSVVGVNDCGPARSLR
jgi:hypothetical protein